MGRITERLIRQRAEHNEGMVSTLEEVALHQQNIEKIEVIGHLCPKLKILYLQNNLIGKIQNLHKLKDLEYLNLAVNNVSKLQNLQRCEGLRKLDLTINFVAKAGLLSVPSLRANCHLEELYLLGNPCSDWPGYRQYVVASLPQLKKLDGQAIRPSERISAQQALPGLHAALLAELAAEGVDVGQAGAVEDDSLYDESGAAVQDVPETGYLDEAGELKRPWCAATRILEHREMEAANRAAEDRKRAASASASTPASASSPSDPASDPQQQPATTTTTATTTSAAAASAAASAGSGVPGGGGRRDVFPELKEGERIYQKNEGRWDFSLEETPDGRSLVLEVGLGRFLDSSLLATDLRPTCVRLLAKGKLLQLLLPCEVRPDAAAAQRNTSNGHLVITMPKENPEEPILDVAKLRPKVPGTTGTASTTKPGCTAGPASAATLRQQSGRGGGAGSGATSIYNIVKTPGGEEGDFMIKEVRRAAVKAVAVEEEDGDDPPDL